MSLGVTQDPEHFQRPYRGSEIYIRIPSYHPCFGSVTLLPRRSGPLYLYGGIFIYVKGDVPGLFLILVDIRIWSNKCIAPYGLHGYDDKALQFIGGDRVGEEVNPGFVALSLFGERTAVEWK
ncbi:hypothetical protein F4821DRAFT_261414 [Hypoxylon rubiginosum]|uniref:Uncharacterized protein n=1 Tax=Hypoxylon rubiginosum TaxID=110542 RepID=A0ACC0CX59_9PEZI|nr:hypothetical protein F4821DRAFT_261414 [Hypoxylon rubiginosum]